MNKNVSKQCKAKKRNVTVKSVRGKRKIKKYKSKKYEKKLEY